MLAVAVALVAACSGPQTAALRPSAPTTSTSTSTPAAPPAATTPTTPTVAGATTSTAGPGCVAISGWSTTRLAAEVIAVPVDEANVGAAAPEVGAGAGAAVLLGAGAPSDLAARL